MTGATLSQLTYMIPILSEVTDEETEGQRDQLTCLASYSQKKMTQVYVLLKNYTTLDESFKDRIYLNLMSIAFQCYK